MKRHYDGIKSINIDSSWPVAKTLHILVQQTHTNTQTHIICTFNIQYIAKLKPWALSFMNMYTTQTHTKMRENGSNLISLYINIIQVVWALTWLVHSFTCNMSSTHLITLYYLTKFQRKVIILFFRCFWTSYLTFWWILVAYKWLYLCYLPFIMTECKASITIIRQKLIPSYSM